MKSVTSIKVASSTLATLSLTVLPRVLSQPPGLEQFKRCHGRLISQPLKVLDLSQVVVRHRRFLLMARSAIISLISEVKTAKNSLEALVRNTGKGILAMGARSRSVRRPHLWTEGVSRSS
ncbi:hypothetical protein OIU79_006443 [Salix purpurea]|uniref:Uncharacterized protein n=1 Tax=Salix purpurea TaxID=77065 RepID=A0A9Q0TVN4_SALPP|nr:hypothetical protein OIU79_006443 [Salix purpurea]